MADPLCRIMDVYGVAQAGTADLKANSQRSVAKVCVDPNTLEITSAIRARLSEAEIHKIQENFNSRTASENHLLLRGFPPVSPEIEELMRSILKGTPLGSPETTVNNPSTETHTEIHKDPVKKKGLPHLK